MERGVCRQYQKRADALTVDNMLEWGSTYYLKQAVENPLDVAYHSIWMATAASLCRTVLCVYGVCL